MKMLNFCKMHALGNDFVVVDALKQAVAIDKLSIPMLADRNLGIGFDQLLVLKPSEQADLYCEIYNADGSQAEQCGNGMRCIARFMHEDQHLPRSHFTVETKGGIIKLRIENYDNITAEMGRPAVSTALTVMHESSPIVLTTVSLGNPHAISCVKTLSDIPLTALANKIAGHSAFPDGVNVGFMEVINRHHIKLRTFERGAGETRACGSNACAAVIAGITKGLLDAKAKVEFASGILEVEWAGQGASVYLKGPATRVYSGVINV